MQKVVLFLMIFFFISCCYAECSENQVDINSASLSELQEITGIGPVYAQRIIDNRPFNSLDELVNVNGIAEKTLEDIKNQGLACVSYNKENNQDNDLDNSSKDEKEKSSEKSYKNEKDDKLFKKSEEENNEIEELKEEIRELKKEVQELKNSEQEEENETKVIKLSPKNIKSEKNNSKIEKSDYAFYGLVAFSVILGLLVYIRKNKLREDLV